MRKNYFLTTTESVSLVNSTQKSSKLYNWLFLILILFFGFSTQLNAQITSGANVLANFAIDGDVHANTILIQPTPPFTASGTDDWFKNLLWPGFGENVIDQTDVNTVKNAILADNNYSFTRRMSKPLNTLVGDYLWIDAVYGRDNNSAQSNKDLSVFTSGQDKNGGDPSTWSLGDGGTPQKNDLIDVFGYLRRDLSVAAKAENGPNGTLWGYGGATTISSDGNSHTDFEFFRSEVEFDDVLGELVNSGSDEGHTAWTFDGTGNIVTPGDILVAIDFENGGTNPLSSVRVWIADAIRATFNTLPNRPFDLTGVFDQGDGATLYGYAEITARTDTNQDAEVFAVVNTTSDVLGAPWGSLEGPQGKYFDDIKTLQFSEFAINLTKLGLDARNSSQNACDNLLGSLLVKTRSSSSFTAELKDFAGPYTFGQTLQNEITITNPAPVCAPNTVSIVGTASGCGVGSTLSYWFDEAATNEIQDPTSLPAGTYYIKCTNDIFADCFDIKPVTVTVNSNPAPTAINLSLCESGNTGSVAFDLDTAVTNNGGGTISFHSSQADADSGSNPLANINAFISSGGTIYIRSVDANGCVGTTSFTLTVYDNPDVTAQNLDECEDGNTGQATFNLNDGVTDADGGSISFYTSQVDADAMQNAIGNPAAYVSGGSETIYVRSDNDNDGTEGCYGTTSFTLTVYDNPDVTAQNLDECEDGNTGQATFNLNDGVTDADGGSISFYTSQVDADAMQNAIGNPAAYLSSGSETIYVRSDNDNDGTEGCYGTTSFTLTVYDNPDVTAQNLDECEDGNTGQATFNLNDGVTDADGGSISFYTSQVDADGMQNAIGNPAAYVSSGSETIYVRSDNDNDGTEGCYGTTSFTLTVYDNPDIQVQDLEACEEGNTGQATFNLNDAVINADGATLSFYTSQADADTMQNAIANPAAYVSGNGSIYYVRGDNPNDNNLNCFGTNSFDITVYDNPDVTAQNLDECEDGNTGQATFNLNDGVTDADGGSISFYTSQVDADAMQNAIGNPAAYVSSGSETIYVRSDNDNDGTEGCYGTTSFTLTVYDNPDVTAQNLESCEEGNTGQAAFNLNDGVTDADGGSISFYTAQVDADAMQNAIGNPAAYVSSGSETIYVRSDNDNDGTEGCYGTTSFTLTVYDNPDIQVQDLEACEEGNTGQATFNLNDAVTNADGGTVSFYTSQADADAMLNAIVNPAAYVSGNGSIYYVRSDNPNDNNLGCFGTNSFDITVYDNPDITVQNLDLCEFENSGMATFDLSNGVTDGDGGTLTYYTSQTDADAMQNAIGNPNAYNSGDATIYVRSDNDNDGTEGCFGTASFTITVNPAPVCSASTQGVVCIGEDIQLFENGGEAISWSWSSNGSATFDNANAQNPVASNAVNGEIFTVTITDANGCVSTCTTTAEMIVCIDECETAYGKYEDGDGAQCFLDSPELGSDNWGWTNYFPCEGEYELPLYAGAAQCNTSNGELVGSATVNYSNGEVTITYNISEGFVMNEAHAYVGCAPYPDGNNGPTTAPGQYPFKASWGDEYVQNYSFEGIEATGGIYVIVHAVTCAVLCTDCQDLINNFLSDDEGGSTNYNGVSIPCYNPANDMDGDLIEDSCDDDMDGDGYTNDVDCNDADSSINPGAEEICGDGIDNNCNGQIDENCVEFLSKTEIQTYPNPFTEYLTVSYKFNYETDVEVNIYDSKGALVHSVVDDDYVEGTLGSKTIKFYDKASTTYIVKVYSDRESMTKMVVADNK